MPQKKRNYSKRKKLTRKKTLSKKRNKKKQKHNLQKLFAFLGMIFIVISLSYKLYNFTANTLLFSRPVQNSCMEEKTIPVGIVIPSITSSLPVEQTFIRNGMWEISKNGASHLSSSSKPGASGNIVVYGHNSVDQLGNLSNVKEGDFIIVKTKDRGLYSYIVKTKKTIYPNDVSILNPTDSEMLTLYTCIGFADSMRFVVQAVPAKDMELTSNRSQACVDEGAKISRLN